MRTADRLAAARLRPRLRHDIRSDRVQGPAAIQAREIGIVLGDLTLIFCCQLVGELVVTALGLPVPGPVLGMALLFAGLLTYGSVPADLASTADALLSNLSLLFVPAGVGVMLHVSLIGQDWLPISIALVLSTLLTVVVTAKVMVWLSPHSPANSTEPKSEEN